MESTETPRGSIFFSLFGIPVVIHPFSWVMLAFLGGALDITAGRDIISVLLFVVAGIVCLLTHEFGHALVGRRLGGGTPVIEINGIGGMTYTPRLPRTRWGYMLLIAAGPLASLLLGMLVGVIYGLHTGSGVARGLETFFTLPLGFAPRPEKMLPISVLLLYFHFFCVCFWWTLFNLLPIFPLDGGKLLQTILNGSRITHVISILLCILLGLLSATLNAWFSLIIMIYLGYINILSLRQRG